MTSVYGYYADVSLDSAKLINSGRLNQTILDKADELKSNKKAQFLFTRYLLAELVFKHYKMGVLPDIVIKENGKPEFSDSNLPSFNISHSQNNVFVVISTDSKIGCDVEVSRPRSQAQKIAEQYFSPIEVDWLNSQPDFLTGFWQLWTRREAAVKLYAKGVWNMKQCAFNPSTWQMNADFGDAFFSNYWIESACYYSICCDKPTSKVEIIEFQY